MDPNATLARIRVLIASRADRDAEVDLDQLDEVEYEHDSDELAYLVAALDEWIRGGGTSPTSWTPAESSLS